MSEIKPDVIVCITLNYNPVNDTLHLVSDDYHGHRSEVVPLTNAWDAAESTDHAVEAMLKGLRQHYDFPASMQEARQPVEPKQTKVPYLTVVK